MIYIKDFRNVSYQNIDKTFHYLMWIRDHNYILDKWHGQLHLTENGHQVIGPTCLGFWSKK